MSQVSEEKKKKKNVSIKEVDEGIWIVSFMQYVLPMSQVRTWENWGG